jgi:hypothetical protein
MDCKFAAEPGQIESSIDLPHQMIFRDRVAKTKLVEQLTLVTLQTAHHRSTSPRIASTNGITLRGLPQTTFATKSATSGSRSRGLLDQFADAARRRVTQEVLLCASRRQTS